MDMPPLPFNPEDEFPILKRWAFFNHSGVSPLPASVARALDNFVRTSAENAYLDDNRYGDAANARKLAARIINAESDEIAFIKNTSEGLAFVANGLDWRAGDEIVSTNVEYPANVYPWMDLEKRCGVRHIMVPEKNGRFDRDDIFRAVTPKTRMITVSHVEYASGFRFDLAPIGAFCRERKILFCVDAIQSIGAFELDVRAAEIDYLSTGGHKWLMSLEGLGFFFCRKSLLDSLRPEIGSMNVADALNYSKFDLTLKPNAQRFECGGQNSAGSIALNAALKLALSVGIPAISARIQALTERLCEGLRRRGYNVFSSRAPGEDSGIVSFSSATHDHKKIVKDLMDQKIVVVIREGRLRAAPHYYNTFEQIDRLVATLP